MSAIIALLIAMVRPLILLRFEFIFLTPDKATYIKYCKYSYLIISDTPIIR